MRTDYNSIEAVASAMGASKLKKFRIQRPGAQKNTPPVFECTGSGSNADAIEKFKSWASLIDNDNAYEMVCFDNEENLSDDPGKTKKGTTKFTFSLGGYSPVRQNASVSGPQINPDDIIERITKRMEENAILQKLSGLEQRINEMEEEEEEDADDDDTEIEMQGNQWNPERMFMAGNLFLDKLTNLINKKDAGPAAAINGPEEKTEKKSEDTTQPRTWTKEEMDRITVACRTLGAADPNFVSNIEIFAADNAKLYRAIIEIGKYDKDFINNLSALAKLAAKDKLTYDFAVSKLKSM